MAACYRKMAWKLNGTDTEIRMEIQYEPPQCFEPCIFHEEFTFPPHFFQGETDRFLSKVNSSYKSKLDLVFLLHIWVDMNGQMMVLYIYYQYRCIWWLIGFLDKIPGSFMSSWTLVENVYIDSDGNLWRIFVGHFINVFRQLSRCSKCWVGWMVLKQYKCRVRWGRVIILIQIEVRGMSIAISWWFMGNYYGVIKIKCIVVL